MGVEVAATVKELAKTGRDLGGWLDKGLAWLGPRAGLGPGLGSAPDWIEPEELWG